MSWYEIFIMVCKIAGVIIMFPVILGLFLSLACWVCYLLCHLMSISIWIVGKLAPRTRSESISSRRKPEKPPPIYSNVNISKEEFNAETKDTEP